MTLPPKSGRMPRAEFAALMASGEWTWRCADMSEREHDDWRMVQIGQDEKPLIFIRVPERVTP